MMRLNGFGRAASAGRPARACGITTRRWLPQVGRDPRKLRPFRIMIPEGPVGRIDALEVRIPGRVLGDHLLPGPLEGRQKFMGPDVYRDALLLDALEGRGLLVLGERDVARDDAAANRLQEFLIRRIQAL